VIGLAGLHAALEFIHEIGLNRLRVHEQELLAQLLEGLRRIPAVTLYGPANPARHGGALSFTVAGFDPATVGYRLDHEFDIGVRVGLHCAPEAHRTIGTFPEGTVRVSPGWFNTHEDIERLLTALRTLVKH
jgi:selenocysteine lyase/cysteine desulfurase